MPSATIDWTVVRRLNAVGATVFSRAVVLHPPADALTGPPSSDSAEVAIVAIGVVFAVLEVALLAGAAFLVGARQQQRTLAVIALVGADGAVLRRITTASGVVLGAAGGVLGLGAGIGAAIGLMRLTATGSWMQYPGLHLEWPLLVAIGCFGVVVGWLAALIPARAASRFDVVRALRGARTPARVGRRPIAGVVLLGLGIAGTLAGGIALTAVLRAGGDASGTPAQLGAIVLLAGGPVLAQLGVLLCAGLVLRGIARALVRAPLPTRLAARDTSRNLGRSVPAAAAVLTTVFVASFVMCIGNAIAATNVAAHIWTTGAVGAGASTVLPSASGTPTAQDAAAQAALLRRDLPVRISALVGSTPQGPDGTTSNRLRDAVAVIHVQDRSCTPERQRVASDLGCGPFSTASGGSTGLTVGSAAALRVLLGHAPTADALATLEAGGAVALRSGVAEHGTAVLDWFTPSQWDDQGTATPRRVSRLAAVTDLPAHPVQDVLFVAPATADRLRAAVTPDRILLDFTRPPTRVELDTATTALGALSGQPGTSGLLIEEGPQDVGSQLAWWILLGCLVIALSAGATAVGLARVDGRADDVTLASLGASPRIRRSVAGVQALIVCGLGATVGTALGMLPAVALGQATTSLTFAPPVMQLALTAAGIPLVIAGGAWLLTSTRRGDLARRTAIA